MSLTVLIDGNNLAHRVNHTFSVMHNGENVSIVHGFMRSLVKLATDYRPDSIIVCWDGGTPEYRKSLIPDYKGNRNKSDEYDIFLDQIETIQKMMHSLGVTNLQAQNVEADDLLFHASKIIRGRCIILTTDGDLAQAITPDGRVKILNPLSKGLVSWDNFQDRIGVSPEQYIDYRAMMGDTSDNLKGVPGIGEAMAKSILKEYGMLDRAWHAARENGSEWRVHNIARTRLRAVSMDHIDATRQVISLASDRYRCSEIVRESIKDWTGYDKHSSMMLVMGKGLSNLMDGVVRKIIKNLRPPDTLQEKQWRIIITQKS